MDGLSFLYRYKSGSTKKLVSALKYDFVPGVIDPAVRQPRLPELRFDLITFVPLHRMRQNWRGFNQAEKLAEHLALISGLKIAGKLVRNRYTQPLAQKHSGTERRREIKSAFSLGKDVDISGKNLILVDDVFTSGATMFEATKVLKRNGAKLVWGWTLAA